MSHSEASLKALTVPKLKELLASAGLSQAGKKDELITRLLDGPSPIDPAAAVEVTSNEAPDAPAPESTAGPEPVAVQVESTTAANDPVPINPAVPVAGDKPAEAEAEVSAEEKAAALKAEQDKREARAARFGQSVPSSVQAGGEDEEAAKAKRGEKYGTGKKEAAPQGIEKSLAALDKPLGARAPREPKQPKAATAPAPAAAKEKAAPKAPEPPKEVDPAVAAKLAEEEEKKRKRAERFGPQPDAKKAKVDA